MRPEVGQGWSLRLAVRPNTLAEPSVLSETDSTDSVADSKGEYDNINAPRSTCDPDRNHKLDS